MILWAALLMCHFGFGGAGPNLEVERITACGTKCSQGLQCKSKPAYFVPPPCRKPTDGLDVTAVFRNLSFSTVMMCEASRKCSLRLRIKTTAHLAKSIQGFSICSETPGTPQKCRSISISKVSRRKMAGMEVEVENDCIDVSPRQKVRVSVTTFPSYCGITQSGTYVAPDCSWKDLRRNIPECSTGQLWHDVDLDRKEVRVGVSEALQGHDYHVRLCRKDFICVGTGANAMIKKEEPDNSVVLSFSRPLPCLCIEGWPAVMDAPRVQVCPFKDALEEMWHGIRFDPLEEALSWEPACPLSARVTLCQRREEDGCSDQESVWRDISREMITFAKVDPHPQLCMKFTAGNQSWIRCPFVKRLQVWDVTLTPQGSTLTSRINATFSIDACRPSQDSTACHATGTGVTVQVGEHSSVNLTDVHGCVLVRRTDVNYAATVLHCPTQHVSQGSTLGTQAGWDVISLGLGLATISVVALAFLFTIAVDRRRKETKMKCVKKHNRFYTSECDFLSENE
ncbi:putative interleukin-17 receptor E-like isoform X1 [Syngnathus typhle]|uniref:putative interleukin-17 receptor E-like isoform X1 n=1 Tax=Syngnathus typhle TaxID=161592 RepID=UPI002A6A9D3A|nr:putative interleukin-17 receptor E-like isoform X1 [Syngnathus typhle]